MIFLALLGSYFCFSQVVELKGIVVGNDGIDGVHIVNKSRKQYATTNALGEFTIKVKSQDTLLISSVQYKLQSLVVSKNDVANKSVIVNLESYVNQLDEVVVGKIFTGDLYADIEVLDVKTKINFYDVGIPGYKGKKKTKKERMLQEASNFGPTLGTSNGGAGGSVSVVALINAISGRTKKLKHLVKLEKNETLMYKIKGRLSKDFFSQNPLENTLQMEFFYFCSEDPDFMKRCQSNDIEVLVFLKEKYVQYKLNRTLTNE